MTKNNDNEDDEKENVDDRCGERRNATRAETKKHCFESVWIDGVKSVKSTVNSRMAIKRTRAAL